MLKINNIRFEINENVDVYSIAEKCEIAADDIIGFKKIKESVDARHKKDIHYSISFAVKLKNEEYYKSKLGYGDYGEYRFEPPECSMPEKTPVIVGAGPAGLFAALYLCECGIKPILIERGCDVDKRIKAVNDFWENGRFSPITNVQFGEGGAGTFSDGKLTTGVNDERLRYIREQFVKHGAPEEILYQSKPHIGTDRLCTTVKSIRNRIVSLGGRVMFETKLESIETDNGEICGAVISRSGAAEKIDCDSIILAIGHSARDTFEMLNSFDVKMERKPFSVGVRIEHLQKDIGQSQYGEMYTLLPPADYKLSVKTKSGRGVYTFCMCPGGYVVASASEENGVVTNGMSELSRNGENANSAVLVTVNPEDIDGDDVLGGMYLQRSIERKAFKAAGEDYFAPVQLVGDFLNNKISENFGHIKPTYRPGTVFGNIREILPDFAADSLAEAIPLFAKKLSAFSDMYAVMTAPETRSSSPVRIVRDRESLNSSVKGLYPCGEGAGYAGGIMSAALDGIKCAEAYIRNKALI